MGLPNPSRETKFSGANADKEVFIFPIQLTTCWIGNFTRLIHNIAICVTIHTYMAYRTVQQVRIQHNPNELQVPRRTQAHVHLFGTLIMEA